MNLRTYYHCKMAKFLLLFGLGIVFLDIVHGVAVAESRVKRRAYGGYDNFYRPAEYGSYGGGKQQRLR